MTSFDTMLIVFLLIYIAGTLAEIHTEIDDTNPNKSHAKWDHGIWNGRK